MDENTWRIVQVIMWAMGIQTTLIISSLGFIWNNLGKRLDKVENKIDSLDKRLVSVETILHMKECCMLQEERNHKKVA
jgi:hypothetical protein